ncbi:hypothetical protein QTN93_11740 [Sphingomonas aerolata]
MFVWPTIIARTTLRSRSVSRSRRARRAALQRPVHQRRDPFERAVQRGRQRFGLERHVEHLGRAQFHRLDGDRRIGPRRDRDRRPADVALCQRGEQPQAVRWRCPQLDQDRRGFERRQLLEEQVGMGKRPDRDARRLQTGLQMPPRAAVVVDDV